MNGSLKIEDISEKGIDVDYLAKAEFKEDFLHRYNREQVLKIAELFYIPHQVSLHNRFVRKGIDRDYSLLRMEGEVKLEDVLPAGLEMAGKLFDAYASLPTGTYYTRFSKPFNEDVTYTEVKKDGSPAQWIAGKKFEGFVTKRLNFLYSSHGNSYIDILPDRDIFVPWNLDCGKPLIHASEGSRFSQDTVSMDEEKLRANIKENYGTWQRLFLKIAPEGHREDIEGMHEWKISLKEVNEAQDQSFGSWEDYFNHLMSDLQPPTSFDIYHCRAKYRELGFIPDTEKVNSVEELADFTIRFLNFRETGEPFDEDAYDKRVYGPAIQQR